jgi:hypothetical protein
MVFLDGKEVEVGGKKFIVHKAPATVAYNAAIQYNMGQENKDATSIMNCIYMLLKYVELVLEDGRKITLDNQEVINQHITDIGDMIKLQTEVVAANFTSSSKENH